MANKLEIWTDGAASPNPGKGGCSWILKYEGHKIVDSRGYKFTTNNRMELLAPLIPLEMLYQKGFGFPIHVHSDSQYLVHALVKGWVHKWEKSKWMNKGVPRVNHDLWKRLVHVDRELDVTWTWVRGHDGDYGNEECDELAVAARLGSDLIVDHGYDPPENYNEHDKFTGNP